MILGIHIRLVWARCRTTDASQHHGEKVLNRGVQAFVSRYQNDPIWGGDSHMGQISSCSCSPACHTQVSWS